MLGGRGRTKRAVGSMRGKKISGLGALRARKAARAARTPATPRRRSPFRRRASAQQRVALGAARGRPRVQAR